MKALIKLFCVIGLVLFSTLLTVKPAMAQEIDCSGKAAKLVADIIAGAIQGATFSQIGGVSQIVVEEAVYGIYSMDTVNKLGEVGFQFTNSFGTHPNGRKFMTFERSGSWPCTPPGGPASDPAPAVNPAPTGPQKTSIKNWFEDRNADINAAFDRLPGPMQGLVIIVAILFLLAVLFSPLWVPAVLSG